MKTKYVLLVVLVSCGGGATVGDVGGSTGAGGSSTCSLLACPAEAYPVCEPGDTTTLCCLTGGTTQASCSRPAGILTHACPASCASDLCAVSAGGTTTCCDFEAVSNPCDAVVP